jgi:hypothetical protein
MKQETQESAQAHEYPVALADFVELPLRIENEDNNESVNRVPALAAPVTSALMRQLRTNCIVRAVVNAVNTDAAPFPFVALSVDRAGVFAVLEPGCARTAELLAGAASRGWLPVVLHDADTAVLVRVDWPGGMRELPGLMSSAAPLAAVPFARGLASSLEAAQAAFERLPEPERPVHVAKYAAVAEARLLTQQQAVKDRLAETAAFRAAATVH